ncbi:MAG: PLDc N-terminal domain-containing protein [Promethearchaeota archaeon]
MQPYDFIIMFFGFFLLIGIISFIVVLALAIYVANDAEKHGENGLLWGIVVFFLPLIGIILYLVVRSSWQQPTPSYQKPSTSQYSGQGFDHYQELYCSNCGAENTYGSHFCKSCGSPL